MLNIKAFLDNQTTAPGVYQMLGKDGEVLYIGKARNLKKRLASYFSTKPKDTKTFALVKHIQDIQVTITHSENDALLLECNLIKKYRPHYNILFRDDKSYPYILIREDKPYACVDLYRGHRKSDGIYFGPYPSVSAVRETIHLIQKLFGLRLSNDRYYPNRTRPCLQYQIGLCSGACAGFISEEDYRQDVLHTILFLQGKNEQVLDDLKKQMDQASEDLNYEKAAKLRDQLAKLHEIQAKQHISIAEGEIDVIGIAVSKTACVQLLVIRHGRILGSRSYFPRIPAHSSGAEIITSFITQHYLDTHNDQDTIPKEIILNMALPDAALLSNALTKIARHKVTLSNKVRGERKKWLETANASAKQSMMSFLLNKTNMEERFNALQTLLDCKGPLARVECFDISHTMGESTVASCVVFNQEGPVKSDYRRFNIKGITPGDDVAAMHQALLRRYQRLQIEQARLPNLILIDGGRTQLTAAINLLKDLNIHGILLVGVAKGVTRKPGFETLYIQNQSPLHLSEDSLAPLHLSEDSLAPLHLSEDSLALHLIQQIRDEAHRFAITGHRQQRDKKRRTSSLEAIPGIGAKRRRELLRYFGGIQAINRASLEELAKVPGISQSLAKRIFATLHSLET